MKKWKSRIGMLVAAMALVPLWGCQAGDVSALAKEMELAPDEAIVDIVDFDAGYMLIAPVSEGPLTGEEIVVYLPDGGSGYELGLEKGGRVKIKYTVESAQTPAAYSHLEIQAREITVISDAAEEMTLQPDEAVVEVIGFGFNRMFVNLMAEGNPVSGVDMVVRPTLGLSFDGLEPGDVIKLKYSVEAVEVPVEKRETHIYAQEITAIGEK